jgi:rhomboid protease GluP
MFNQQSPQNTPPPRRRHPLEEEPARPAAPPPPDPAQPPVRLRMAIVPPLVTYALVALNVLIFVLGLLLPEVGLALREQGASSTRDVLVHGQYYRLFTAMFLHASLPHIFFNAYALYIIGTMLEPVFGHVRFVLIYLLGGLAGSVLSVIMGNPNVVAYSVGASGAVFAIFGAEMIYLYRHREMMGERGQAQFRSLLMLLVINFFIGIASSFEGARVRIDNWAHLGGLLGGLALTWFVGPFYRLTRDPANPRQIYADDTNPLENRYGIAVLFLLALVGILAVAVFFAR